MVEKGSPRFSYRLTQERKDKIFQAKKLIGENTTAKTIDASLNIVLNLKLYGGEIPSQSLKKIVKEKNLGRFL